MEAEKDVYTAMLERQPSLRTIRTKVESRPEPSTTAITGSGSARYRANGGRAIGRGVNFDKDGNTPRSGGDGEMLGSIDSGTPNFFRDSLTLKDDAIGGRPISVKRWAYSALGSTPNTTENGYFNNDELADLLNIVHGKNGDDGYDADTPHDATRIALLHTPTFAQVNNMKAAAGTQEWEEAGHAFKPVEPSASKKRKSMSAPASAAKSKKPKSETKQRSSTKDEVPLSKEEEAMKKMKAFSTRGSNLRTVEDEELLETLVDIHGAPLSKEMKKLCLKHNQRALALNHDHELDAAALRLGSHRLVRSMGRIGDAIAGDTLRLQILADGKRPLESEMMIRLVSILGLLDRIRVGEADQLDRSSGISFVELGGDCAQR